MILKIKRCKIQQFSVIGGLIAIERRISYCILIQTMEFINYSTKSKMNLFVVTKDFCRIKTSPSLLHKQNVESIFEFTWESHSKNWIWWTGTSHCRSVTQVQSLLVIEKVFCFA